MITALLCYHSKYWGVSEAKVHRRRLQISEVTLVEMNMNHSPHHFLYVSEKLTNANEFTEYQGPAGAKTIVIIMITLY